MAVANDAKDKCGKGDSKDGCCNTKYAHFKVKDSHLVSAELATPEKLFIDLHTSTSALQSVALIAQEVDLINGSHAPPLHTGVPVYILNCVFRI